MRILLITQWFDPEPTFKGMPFARELQRLGHDVEVLTGFPNYPGGKIYPGYRIRPWQREEVDGVRVLRVALIPSHSRSVIGRILNYLSFAATASIGVFFTRRADIVYAYHPPGTAALPALLLHLVRRVPYVLDIQDMWPDTLASTGMVRFAWIMRLLELLMRKLYSRAAHIVVLSPGFRRLLMDRGVPAETITVIPNWTYEDAATLPPDRSARAEQAATAAMPAGPFWFLFAGTMGVLQKLDTVLDAAALLEKRAPEARFLFLGEGIDRARLQEEVTQRKLRNISFAERLPPDEATAFLTRADCLLVHLQDDPLFAITIPSKIQAYLRIGRPILAGVRGDAADMITEAAAGLTCAPEDPAALAAAAEAMMAQNTAQLERMGRNGAAFYRAKLAREIGVARFADLFARIVGGRGERR